MSAPSLLFTGISAPAVNPEATSRPAPRPSGQFIPPEAVAGAARFTVRHAAFFAHPKYSLFIQGVKLLGERDSGYFKGLNTFLGGLMVMASPGWAVVRVVGGGVPAAVGAVATGLLGTGYAAQEGVRAIVAKTQSGSKEAMRAHLTEQFVNKMHEIMNGIGDTDGRDFFMQNPDQLISITLVSVAFLSREVEGLCIKVGDSILGLGAIQNQDQTRRGYFHDLCDMKEAIRDMRLSLVDDDHAWRDLMTKLEEAQSELHQVIVSPSDCFEEPEVDADLADGWAYIPNEKDPRAKLMRLTRELSAKIISDRLFQQVWRASLA